MFLLLSNDQHIKINFFQVKKILWREFKGYIFEYSWKLTSPTLNRTFRFTLFLFHLFIYSPHIQEKNTYTMYMYKVTESGTGT